MCVTQMYSSPGYFPISAQWKYKMLLNQRGKFSPLQRAAATDHWNARWWRVPDPDVV